MPEYPYYPEDADGKPKVLVSVSEEDKIGLADYSNVVIRASISRFVNDNDETLSEEFEKAHGEIVEFLDQTYITERRDAMREELKGE